ncbi:hypothetical protein CFK39_14285 [Brachybacterium avium]|uniref:Uncharacterized protein n=1 Tax=Brachybacterium avium TaxID=2017485 RepID=A0A220UFP1_9MICO|nr:DUF4097 family beta strand repeat-containing protein [Brachybacterium avium]ASK66781.1 hypothetical protein CFK39_14285 [Brachybacterium avium]
MQETGTAQLPPSAPAPLIIPGHRLPPSPGGDRRLRRATTLIGAVIVLLVVLGLALLSTATWFAGRSFTAVPAISELGSPAAVTLDSGTGTVRVLPSGDVDELTLALVSPGVTTLPSPDARVPARITQTAGANRTSVDVRQPTRSFSPPWSDETLDVLLLVPTALELALEVRAGVGDIVVDGDLTSLEAHADAGNLRLGPLSAPDGVNATTEVGSIDLELDSPSPAIVHLTAAVGDVDLLLPTDAGGEVSISTDLGDVEVSAPGTAHWQIRADSELGEVHTAPGLTDGAGEAAGTLAVTSELGNIDITR